MSIQIICMGCGEQGETDRPVPEMLHVCGSKDVDVWLDTPEQRRVVARRAGPEPVFAAFMRAAAQEPMPKPTNATSTGYVGTDPEPGWDEYPGPGPHPNGLNAPTHTDLVDRAPTKKQPGVVEESNLYVYDKHHPLSGYGEDVPAPLVAPHEYPAPFVTKTPFLGRRKTRPATVSGLPLPGASCPRCGTGSTAIVTDDREHAHWYCSMRLCGSLVDLDKHPEVNPYQPGAIRTGRDEFWHGRKVAAVAKDGQLMARITKVAQVNPGLSLSEVVYLARQSVIQYPEA